MIDDIPTFILELVGVSATVTTVIWRFQKSAAEKHRLELEALEKRHIAELKAVDERHAAELKKLEELFKKELLEIRDSIRDWEDLRRNGDHALHERINTVETEAYKEINTRLSHIEGQLKGMNNVTSLMERWLVENGGKVS